MPTTPTTPNTAFATGAAAAAARRARRRARVAAGAVARLVIPEVTIRAYLVELGGDAIDRAAFDDAAIDANPFFCPDPAAAARWEALVDDARKDGSSLGAIVECVATGVPAGWGAPVYAKLDAELAAAMMSINAVKGVEIGDGFAAARLRGEDNADEMRRGADGRPDFLSNHAGGVLGGISTGQPIVVRMAFKPTSSMPDAAAHRSTRAGEETEISTKGRHDPCVGIRGAPVAEAMMALVLADQKLLHRAQCGDERMSAADPLASRSASARAATRSISAPACSTVPANGSRPLRARWPADRRSATRRCGRCRATRFAAGLAAGAIEAVPILLPPGEGSKSWTALSPSSTGCSSSASSAATISSPSAAA